MSYEGAERLSLPPARRGRRFGSHFVDVAVVAMASMIVFAAAGAPIFDYYGKAEAVSASYDALSAEAAKTHLLEEGAGVPTDQKASAMVTDWLYLQIEGRFADDFLLYADTTYMSLSLEEHNGRFFFLEEGAFCFEVGESGAAVLAPETAESVSLYLNSGYRDEATVAAYGLAHDAVLKVYQDIWVDIGSDEALPYRGLLEAYGEATNAVRYAGGGAAIVSYFLTALVFYVAVPLIVHRGRTFPKVFTRLEVCSLNGKPPSVYQIVSRGIILSLETLWLSIFAPFFFLSFQAISLPVFAIGSVEFVLWNVGLVGFLLEVFSGALTLFTPNRSTLHDLSTLTRVVERDDLEEYKLKAGREAE